jgi:hypothetical protein
MQRDGLRWPNKESFLMNLPESKDLILWIPKSGILFQKKKLHPWYVNYFKLIQTHYFKGGLGVIEYFKWSHIAALIAVYPELHLKSSDFVNSKRMMVW